MNGGNTKDNLVKLTAREHYFAHALLSRIFDNAQMAMAWYMTTRKYKQDRVLSPYKIKKASDSRIGKKRPDISAAQTGKKRGPLSPEHRAKLSAATKGIKRGPASPEHCANISAARTGMKFGTYSPEHCAKISAAKTGKKRGPLSAEWRAAISAGLMGNTYAKGNKGKKRGPLSPEWRAAISAGKQRYALKKKLASSSEN